MVLTDAEIEEYYEGPQIPKLKNYSRRELNQFLPKYSKLLRKIDVLKGGLKQVNKCLNCPCLCVEKTELPTLIELDQLWQRVNHLKCAIEMVVAMIEVDSDEAIEIPGLQTLLYLSTSRENLVRDLTTSIYQAIEIRAKYHRKKVAAFKFCFQCRTQVGVYL